MSSQVKVPWSTRLGFRAEDQVRSRLLGFSIPIKYEIDPGIDFYCELIENDTPSTQFYVQAKGTKHFDDNGGQSIKKSTVRYWLNQLFPVFLVVYDENSKKCYWMSIEDRRYSLLEQIDTPSKTIYIKIEKSHVLEQEREANREFIDKIREDTLSIQMSRGIASFRGQEYVKKIPMAPRSDVEVSLLKEMIRSNSYSLIQHYGAKDDLESIYDLCSFLARFDKWHYNHFVWLGMACKQLGRREEARNSFDKALEICEMDKTWPRKSMEKIKESIRRAREGV
jgi:hypothetical protein